MLKLNTVATMALLAVAPMAHAGKVQNKASADGPPVQQGLMPEESVRALYSPYLPGGNERLSAFDNETERAKRFTADLSRQLSAYFKAQENKDEPGGLDFDPIVNGQDYKIERLDIRTDNVTPGKSAVVIAEFTNADELMRLKFKLAFEGGSWRVDNIASLREPVWDLRDILKEN